MSLIRLLRRLFEKSVKEGRHLAAVLAEIPEVTTHLSAAELKQLETPEQYLGRQRLSGKLWHLSPIAKMTTRSR